MRRAIKPIQPVRALVTVPGSKSYTHRMVIAAALSDGRTEIENALESEDTILTREALRKWRIPVRRDEGPLVIYGRGGELRACAEPVFLGNSGTSMRLLTAVAALAKGRSILTGTERLQARPVQDLLSGLRQAGVSARSLAGNGLPPIEIDGGGVNGGSVELDCSLSSQFLSAMLLIGPYTRTGLEIGVRKGPVSRPYIDITLDTMTRFGVRVQRRGYEWFKVAGGQHYQAGCHTVEPDCSQAGYFWAAAAISGSTVEVKDARTDSYQGDIRLLEILLRMGCRIVETSNGVAVSGGELRAVEVDMGDIPDVVPTLAVVAAFAQGRTIIHNVAHLREKESDRLAAVAAGLAEMGINAGYDLNTIWIEGGVPHAATIDCRNDHRIAMSFAAAGLRTPGVVLSDGSCVQKSFPTFWDVFETLYR